MPFRAVDQEDFRDWIHDLNPKYKLPNRHKVAATVLELYYTEKEKIKRVVDGLRGIDKVFSITVDNASANDTAIAHMKRRLKSNGALLLEGAHLHMRCACHILNLIVKDGMTELSREIEGIRNCVKFIHSSPTRLETFREYCVLMRFDKMSNIPFDVVTRWNATYDMLNSAFKFKQVFSRMADECNTFISYFQEEVSKEINEVTTKVKQVGPPVVEDWERAMSFAHFLKKFYDSTLTLSATLTPTSNLILGMVIALQVEIEEKICNSSNATLQSVATSMKLKFDKYWGDIEKVNPILFIAQALDPRYKFELLEASLKELCYSCEAILDVKTSIKKNLTDLFKVYKEGDVSSSSSVTVDQRPSVVEDDSSGLEDDVATRSQRKIQQKRAAAQQNEISNEVDMYFNDPHQSLTYEVAPLLVRMLLVLVGEL
nr:zinc finger BED domain-containing protein RICESLEEPER 2-like [Malus domestica]